MENFLKAVGAGLIIALLIFLLAVLNGTILWCIYPHIHMLFNQSTILAERLEWWDSVCITWIFGILIKSSNTNNNKKE